MKQLTGITPEKLVDYSRGDPLDGAHKAVMARIIKRYDGCTFTERDTTIRPLSAEAWPRIEEYIRRSRGTVMFRSHGSTRRAFVAYSKGTIDVSRVSCEPGGNVRFRRYRRSTAVSIRKDADGLKGKQIGVSVNLFGEERWVADMLSRIQTKLEPYKVAPKKKPRAGSLYVLSVGSKGPRLKSIAMFEDKLERANYTSKVLEKYDDSVRTLGSENPSGRLLIVHGPPGTGKTFMVRGMIRELDKSTKCVLVPAHFIPSFTDPMFGSMLLRHKKRTILIIEDADMLLVKRGSDNMSAIHAMLNLADGMFGAIADVRIVCTTNARQLELDPAIGRRMRLIDSIEVPKLPAEHATRRLEQLRPGSLSEFDKPTTLADVYAEALGVRQDESSTDTTAVGFSTRRVSSRPRSAG